jgi:hypothetical protein
MPDIEPLPTVKQTVFYQISEISSYYDEMRSDIETVYRAHGNIIQVWEMIALWCHAEQMHPGKYPMPDWCVAYLRESASHVTSLAAGEDLAGVFAPEHYLGNLKPNQNPLSIMAQVLRFSRKGKSAFKDNQSRLRKYEQSIVYKVLRDRGASAREAMDRLLANAGLADDRNMRRRFSEASSQPGKGET